MVFIVMYGWVELHCNDCYISYVFRWSLIRKKYKFSLHNTLKKYIRWFIVHLLKTPSFRSSPECLIVSWVNQKKVTEIAPLQQHNEKTLHNMVMLEYTGRVCVTGWWIDSASLNLWLCLPKAVMVGKPDPPCSWAGRLTEGVLHTALTVEEGKGGGHELHGLSTGTFIQCDCVTILGVYPRYPPPS